jgi:hypothetical protein
MTMAAMTITTTTTTKSTKNLKTRKIFDRLADTAVGIDDPAVPRKAWSFSWPKRACSF